MLPTTQKVALGRQNHVPVLHHWLPIYEILCAPHPIGVAEAPEKKKKNILLLPTQTTRRQKMHKSPPGNLPDPHSDYGNIQVWGNPENSSATPVITWDQNRESLTNITTLNIIGPIATKNIVKNLLPPPSSRGLPGPNSSWRPAYRSQSILKII